MLTSSVAPTELSDCYVRMVKTDTTHKRLSVQTYNNMRDRCAVLLDEAGHPRTGKAAHEYLSKILAQAERKGQVVLKDDENYKDETGNTSTWRSAKCVILNSVSHGVEGWHDMGKTAMEKGVKDKKAENLSPYDQLDSALASTIRKTAKHWSVLTDEEKKRFIANVKKFYETIG